MTTLYIRLFETTAETLKTKSLLEAFFKKYDLSPYLFTKSVKIKPNVIPHSHPMLTLNTFWNDSPNHLLSTFLHEQIHWFLNWSSPQAYRSVHHTFMEWYPSVPTDRSQTASNVFSTYLHLAVCWLELQGVKRYLGASIGYQTIQTFQHYRWVYDRVVKDESRIGEVMSREGLII